MRRSSAENTGDVRRGWRSVTPGRAARYETMGGSELWLCGPFNILRVNHQFALLRYGIRGISGERGVKSAQCGRSLPMRKGWDRITACWTGVPPSPRRQIYLGVPVRGLLRRAEPKRCGRLHQPPSSIHSRAEALGRLENWSLNNPAQTQTCASCCSSKRNFHIPGVCLFVCFCFQLCRFPSSMHKRLGSADAHGWMRIYGL